MIDVKPGPCLSCKVVPCEHEKGLVRCEECHARFRIWLDGTFYSPSWNGLISQPECADDPRSSLDRALQKKKEE